MKRTIFAKDCLDVLNDPNALPDESVDLIYLDPPFNSKSTYNLPFKGQYKRDAKPVMAFKDTWSWTENEEENLSRLKSGEGKDCLLAEIVEIAKRVFKERPNAAVSTSAYLLNMAIRLKPMKRVLKKTGSIYLHCDPTASHYLKMLMDAIFGEKNFKNEIIWHYQTGGASKKWFSKKHDTILFYTRTDRYTFNSQDVRVPRSEKSLIRAQNPKGARISSDDTTKLAPDVWIDVAAINPMAKERLGYPTQKPLALLDRIIKASSNEGDIVFDPFCGCGTTFHAAENLKRQWVGIDISQFSAGLVRNRLLENFPLLNRGQIPVIGCPLSAVEAEELAKTDPFEFEKWACGEVGAEGLFHEPGERGADGGIDGVIPFYYGELFDNKPPKKTFAVVQVKGGKVHPDSVKALSTTVRQSGAECGVFICFEKYMNTVEKNREKKRLKDMTGEFNFIQGLSIEKLIQGELPNIPGIRRAA